MFLFFRVIDVCGSRQFMMRHKGKKESSHTINLMIFGAHITVFPKHCSDDHKCSLLFSSAILLYISTKLQGLLVYSILKIIVQLQMLYSQLEDQKFALPNSCIIFISLNHSLKSVSFFAFKFV